MFVGHLGQEAHMAEDSALSNLAKGHVREPEAEDVAHELGVGGSIEPIPAFGSVAFLLEGVSRWPIQLGLQSSRGVTVTRPVWRPSLEETLRRLLSL